MSDYTCNFCNKNFKSNNTLKHHQTNTKYCLKIQLELNKNVKDTLKECAYCNKKFSTTSIKRHNDTCKQRINYNNSISVAD